jgi:hypothetical protein
MSCISIFEIHIFISLMAIEISTYFLNHKGFAVLIIADLKPLIDMINKQKGFYVKGRCLSAPGKCNNLDYRDQEIHRPRLGSPTALR